MGDWVKRHKGLTAALILLALILLGHSQPKSSDGSHPGDITTQQYDAVLTACSSNGETTAEINRCLVDTLGLSTKNLPAGTPVAP